MKREGMTWILKIRCSECGGPLGRGLMRIEFKDGRVMCWPCAKVAP